MIFFVSDDESASSGRGDRREHREDPTGEDDTRRTCVARSIFSDAAAGRWSTRAACNNAKRRRRQRRRAAPFGCSISRPAHFRVRRAADARAPSITPHHDHQRPRAPLLLTGLRPARFLRATLAHVCFFFPYTSTHASRSRHRARSRTPYTACGKKTARPTTGLKSLITPPRNDTHVPPCPIHKSYSLPPYDIY